MTPTISVILPVYNGEKYLSQAIESVLSQSYSDFELITINDGSTDNTLPILQHWKEKDSRIIIINRENHGLVHTLNEGLFLARGKYIARMDADDISFPKRFEYQVDYLENNPDVVLLGVNVIKSLRFRWKFSEISEKRTSTWGLVFRNNIGHPGVMMRANILRENNLLYRQDYKHAEDFKLWCEITRYGYADILPQSLLYYRVHPDSVSAVHRKAQAITDRNIVMENILEKFGINMAEYFNLDVRSWINNLTDQIFESSIFKNLPLEDQNSIYQTYQDYCAGFGIRTFYHYLQAVGVRRFFATGLRAPISIYRAIKRQSRKEWIGLEI